MNSFGSKFRITLFGESHGPVVGVVIDGVRPGISLTGDDFIPDLDRRRPGAAGTTARAEKDSPRILSGVWNGLTTGTPVAVVFENENVRSADYDTHRTHPRPSHADFTANIKYGGFNDPRGGGQFSGRMTVALVAAGVVAKKMLGEGVSISAEVVEIGGVADAAGWDAVIDEARHAGDSCGGIVECVAEGVTAGWGDPFFGSVESVMSQLLFSVPGVKGVEFGSGFAGSALRGSRNNDPITDASGGTVTNSSGGINGGITNGNPVTARIAIKPTPSISAIQHTFDLGKGSVQPLSVTGRHDACIALRIPVVAEACMAIALAQFV